MTLSAMRAGRSSFKQSPRLWPPPLAEDETEEEKQARVKRELKAKEISDRIDQEIEMEKGRIRKYRPDTKILLLGQAESGKSTILKNFQLHFAPSSFQAEMQAWRSVIYLNLCRTVNFIFDLLEASKNEEPPSPTTSNSKKAAAQAELAAQYLVDLRRLRIKLSPLRNVEQLLTRRISAEETNQDSDKPRYHHDKASEVSVRSGSQWKLLSKSQDQRITRYKEKDDLEDARRVVEACRDDMIELWSNPTVQIILRSNDILLHEQSGFFLSEVARIASSDYDPTSDDILRARLRTAGVEEHRIKLEDIDDGAREWVIYDLGGSRSQRAAWASFFDDVNVIIFLAPIAAFNQELAEDVSVNRLSDSFSLWTTICSNKILADTQIILLLNKCDLLEAKLNSGIRFSKYVPSYTKSNDKDNVTKYLITKFQLIHQQCSPAKRMLHMHLTCAIDTLATAAVLQKIKEVLLVENLKQSSLI